MRELRRIFALLIASKRKYIDPTKAVDILKEAFTSWLMSFIIIINIVSSFPDRVPASGQVGQNAEAGAQQDVSEFQHKLLEWLEDAFKHDQNTERAPASDESTDT